MGVDRIIALGAYDRRPLARACQLSPMTLQAQGRVWDGGCRCWGARACAPRGLAARPTANPHILVGAASRRTAALPRDVWAMVTPFLRLDHARALLARAGVSLPPADDPAEVQAIIDALCELSERDALTGLPNRRAFLARVAQELDRSTRSGESSLLLMFDIDHFKGVNDVHGHLAGDAVIRAVGAALRDHVRPMDTVARLGGEEFGVLLPQCSVGAGAVLAERLREAVQATRVELPDGKTALLVTVSVGGAYSPPWVRSSIEHWLGRADRQLYLAKRQGRNRVCIEPVVMSDVSAEEKQLLFGWAPPDDLIIDAAEAL